MCIGFYEEQVDRGACRHLTNDSAVARQTTVETFYYVERCTYITAAMSKFKNEWKTAYIEAINNSMQQKRSLVGFISE